MGLHFVNWYPTAVSICILWYNRNCGPRPWRKSGWWNLAINGSVQVLSGTLNNRYYYFHAQAADGAQWGDNSPRVMISDNAFDVCVDGSILVPSYLAPFRIIDKGDNASCVVTLRPR